MTISTIASRLASALRVSPCRCLRDYDMKVVQKCSRCEALELFDLHVTAARSLGEAAREDKQP